MGKHTRSVQLKIEKVRVVFPSLVSSALPSSVCGVLRGVGPLAFTCDLYCHSPPGDLNCLNLPSQWDILWII